MSHPANNSVLAARTAGGGLGRAPAAMVRGGTLLCLLGRRGGAMAKPQLTNWLVLPSGPPGRQATRPRRVGKMEKFSSAG